MNTIYRFFKIVTLAVVLITWLSVLSGCQPSATTTRTESAGTLQLVEEVENPFLAIWWAGPFFHIRHMLAIIEGDFSDDRLDGEYQLVVNMDSGEKVTLENWKSGKWWSTVVVRDQQGRVIWEGEISSVVDENLMENPLTTLSGVSIYKGLNAEITCPNHYHEDLTFTCQGVVEEVVQASPREQVSPRMDISLKEQVALRIMPLGDTLVEGFCDEPKNCPCFDAEELGFSRPLDGSSVKACGWAVNYKFPEMAGFRSFLRDRLEDWGVQTTYVGSVSAAESLAHEGHFGFTIDDLDYCVQNAGWLETTQPDFILLYAGETDVHFVIPPDDITANLEILLGHIYTKVPSTTEVIVAQLAPAREGTFPFLKHSDLSYNEIVKQYNARIPGVVEQFRADGKHVSYVDMSGVIHSDSEFDESGVNPNKVAYARMADVWLNKITEILAQRH